MTVRVANATVRLQRIFLTLGKRLAGRCGELKGWPFDHTPVNETSSNTIRVLAAVVRRGERYLVCQRPPHKRHGGLWEFPGGKCELGESDADAARRELSEELGVAVATVGSELFAAQDPGSNFLIAFVEVTIDGDPVCHEHSAAKWVLPGEMVHLQLAPSDRQFAQHLLEKHPDMTTSSHEDKQA